MVGVMYGCCVGDWDKFQRYVARPAPHRQFTALSGQASIAVAYNRILDCARFAAVDMLVLQHDDLEITDPEGEEKLLTAVDGEDDVALVGVAGGGSAHGLAWWNADPVGHQTINSGLLDFGARSGQVDLLEGSLLAFSPWAIKHLRFDEVEGFHGYDEIAMKSLERGKVNWVADVDTFHHTDLGFKSTESEREWLRASERFWRKWGSS